VSNGTRRSGRHAPVMHRFNSMLSPMFKSAAPLGLYAATLCAAAQAPSAATLDLSLKTMNRALAGCRESYTQVYPGSQEPFIKPIVGADNYDKDLKSLDHAEAFTSFMLAHPDKVSGKMLVAVLSTSDDFSVGVGSTRSEVLRHNHRRADNA
jgi:hypothetical protein